MGNLFLMKTYEKEELGLYGFIDINGEWIIEPIYKDAEEFSDGLAKVRTVDDKYAFINKDNKIIMEIPDDEWCCCGFRSELLNITKEESEKYVDKDGNIVIDYGITPFRESWFDENGYLIIEEDNKCGVIDKKGNIIVKPKYNTIIHYSDGAFSAELDGKWGFIDKNDNIIIEFKYKNVGKFSEGVADVVTFDDKIGFINKKGKYVIEPRFNATGDNSIMVFSKCSEGLILIGENRNVKIDGECFEDMLFGYIDLNGDKVIDTKFSEGEMFTEGLAVVRESYEKGERCGYIDKTGKFIIKPIFDGAKPFKSGAAFVRYGWEWGYLNRNGSWIYKPKGFPNIDVWNRE